VKLQPAKPEAAVGSGSAVEKTGIRSAIAAATDSNPSLGKPGSELNQSLSTTTAEFKHRSVSLSNQN